MNRQKFISGTISKPKPIKKSVKKKTKPRVPKSEPMTMTEEYYAYRRLQESTVELHTHLNEAMLMIHELMAEFSEDIAPGEVERTKQFIRECRRLIESTRYDMR